MNYVTRSMLTIPLINSNDRPLGVLQIINAQDSDGNVISFDDDAILFIKYFADSATQALEHSYLTNSMIMRMQKMAEYRDPKETFHHVQRVAEFSDVIYVNWAKRNGVPVEKMERYRDLLRIAAKCHDLGKVGVSDIILKKPGPGRFTDDERSTMKGHTCIGALLFSDMESEIDSLSRDVALRHHEWWDGSENGYPGDFDFRGYVTGEPIPKSRPLKGEEIPFAARIVAIADVFDALSHRRVYKEAWSVDDAFIEIQQLSGVQFDPELVMCFLSEREKVCAINRMWESEPDFREVHAHAPLKEPVLDVVLREHCPAVVHCGYALFHESFGKKDVARYRDVVLRRVPDDVVVRLVLSLAADDHLRRVFRRDFPVRDEHDGAFVP